jgi:tRNA nucleotidyltransferase (CCA-adding enzyme)
MIALGYRPVGKKFPVFLHPQTNDEYALARKEIKTGDKHTDFEFIFSSDVSLKEDVVRRDFRMNALAYDDETGEIIDYVGGVQDIQDKKIRHIDATHFVEDPLRVLRMCRFAAQLNFQIDEETMFLAKKMVNENQLSFLSAERIFAEFEKAMNTGFFDVFISAMKECGALKKILPEVDELFLIPEKEQYHPEKNSGEHTLLSLKVARKYDPVIQFAVLMHDIGKILTPKSILPSHYGHDLNGLIIVKEICKRLKIPNYYKKYALVAVEYHMIARKSVSMNIDELYYFVSKVTNRFKNKDALEKLFFVCQADIEGRGMPLEQKEFDNLEQSKLRAFSLFEAVKKIKIRQMSDFNDWPKDKNFQLKLDSYILDILKAKKI